VRTVAVLSATALLILSLLSTVGSADR